MYSNCLARQPLMSPFVNSLNTFSVGSLTEMCQPLVKVVQMVLSFLPGYYAKSGADVIQVRKLLFSLTQAQLLSSLIHPDSPCHFFHLCCVTLCIAPTICTTHRPLHPVTCTQPHFIAIIIVSFNKYLFNTITSYTSLLQPRSLS